ncbi:PREDICTED: LOW QUALITY PROTEIN: doublesex- and mab-3-related transcription factor A2 [Aptenodytes forsteri]|uniref:LOW QUALITY PROTEIN: doublesex- and mab-3-related transcription factor A2 n=1 Tax=Aptenodytes forsteri TaxID=9233 RepID=UPI0004F44A90|nr:PREDICTED: LOW QUALITY PROTEIN: doublesex- and mab-3-related transcription factor A2 [Aptenodytes forsteri]
MPRRRRGRRSLATGDRQTVPATGKELRTRVTKNFKKCRGGWRSLVGNRGEPRGKESALFPTEVLPPPRYQRSYQPDSLLLKNQPLGFIVPAGKAPVEHVVTQTAGRRKNELQCPGSEGRAGLPRATAQRKYGKSYSPRASPAAAAPVKFTCSCGALPGTSSPEARHGSGSENGDGESFLSSPVSKGPKEGEESPGSISPLGSDSGSEADKAERAPSPSAGGRQRTPIDILTRVFPAHKRSVLELVLQGCGGDVVQAIEQILNNRGPEKGPEEGWARDGAPSARPPPPPPAPPHRPLVAGAMAPAIGTLGSRSAFSPLPPHATHFGAEAGAYPLGTHLGLNPLRLAYSAHSRGLAFMTPYSTAGLMPTLGFRPPVDYAFSDLMRDRSAVHKEQVYSGGLYGPMVNNTPEKQ